MSKLLTGTVNVSIWASSDVQRETCKCLVQFHNKIHMWRRVVCRCMHQGSHLERLFVDVHIVPHTRFLSLAKEEEVPEEKNMPETFLLPESHQELILPNQLPLFLQVHLCETKQKLSCKIKTQSKQFNNDSQCRRKLQLPLNI